MDNRYRASTTRAFGFSRTSRALYYIAREAGERACVVRATVGEEAVPYAEKVVAKTSGQIWDYLVTSDESIVLLGSDFGSEAYQIAICSDSTSIPLWPMGAGTKYLLGCAAPAAGKGAFTFLSNERRFDRFDAYLGDTTGFRKLIFENPGRGFLSRPICAQALECSIVVANAFDHDRLFYVEWNGRAFELDLPKARYKNVRWRSKSEILAVTNWGREFYYLAWLSLTQAGVVEVARFSGDVEYFECDADVCWIVVNERGESKLFRLDLLTKSCVAVLAVPPHSVLGRMDERIAILNNHTIAVSREAPWEPVHGIIVNSGKESRARIPSRQSTNALPKCARSRPERVTWNTFDGTELSGWYYRGKLDQLAVYLHGGPESEFRPGNNAEVEWLVDSGVSVLAPNVRGSTGRGKDFAALDDRHLRFNAIRDVAYIPVALRASVPYRPILMGNSYGAFLALATLADNCGPWGGAIGLSGFYNFSTFLAETSEHRREFREREYGSLREDRVLLDTLSPLGRANSIRVPVLLIHGLNDTIVRFKESERMYDALRASGCSVELELIEGEAHALGRAATVRQTRHAIATFLTRLRVAGVQGD